MNKFGIDVLAGLPPYGPGPEQFSSTGKGTHSEGFVVRFQPLKAEEWVGNFQPGLTGFSGCYYHPNGRSAVIVSGGDVYVIDPDSRQLEQCFGGDVEDVLKVAELELLVFVRLVDIQALDKSGIAWRTKRLSWDGIKNVVIDGKTLTGEAWTFDGDRWCPFSVDLATGESQGGVYIF